MKRLKGLLCCLCAIFMLFAIAACNTGGNNDGEIPTDIPTETPAEVMNTGATDVPHFTSVPFENAVLTPEDIIALNEYTNLGSHLQNLLETENSIYIVKDGLLYYSDKEYHEWMPLCGKPECVHVYDNVDCNAYLGGEPHPDVEYYDGYIYYADTSDTIASAPIKLYRMNPDGSNHELFKELERPKGEYTIMEYSERWHSAMFCGRYYLYYYYVDVTEDSAIDPEGLYAVDIADIDKEPVKLNDTFEHDGKTLSPVDLAQKGELIYGIAGNEEDGETVYYITERNLSTGRDRVLTRLNNWLSIGERHFTIYGNEAFLMTTDQVTLERWLFRLDLETGEMTEIAYDGELTQLWSNLDPKAGILYMTAQAGSRYGDTWLFGASDLNGNELWRAGEEVLPEGVASLRISFVTEDYIFFYDKRDGNYLFTLPKWYVEKSAIAMGHVEIKAWEP